MNHGAKKKKAGGPEGPPALAIIKLGLIYGILTSRGAAAAAAIICLREDVGEVTGVQ